MIKSGVIQLGDKKWGIVYESQKSILDHLARLEFQHVGSWDGRIDEPVQSGLHGKTLSQN